MPAKKRAAKNAGAARNRPRASRVQPLRFAHPFFNPAIEPPGHAPGTRLLVHVAQNLQKIPPVKGTSVMDLATILGAQHVTGIAASGALSFHAVGDSGRSANSPQGTVAEAMAADYDVNRPATSPAFFFHLGDVIYGPHKDQAYRQEFYEPYVHYPGKIIAIAGNHDGEVFQGTDTKTLNAFLANFCAAQQVVPAIAGTIFRETMNQPGVYWLLRAPFVDIIGLYSNVAENPGFICGTIPGMAQKTWLIARLQELASERKTGSRKALVIATHHPPFTSGGHSPSTDMLTDLDDASQQAGLYPDLFLSGHAHSYQRYTRFVNVGGRKLEIPFIVAGTGGIGDQAVLNADGKTTGDHRYDKSYKGFGYLTVAATATTIAATYTTVDPNDQTKKNRYDVVTVDLAKGTVK